MIEFLRRRVDLVPVNHLIKTAEELVVTGDDPYFYLETNDGSQFPKGRYEFVINLAVLDKGSIGYELYLDEGNGFVEDNKINCVPFKKLSDGRLVFHIALSSDVRALRFDLVGSCKQIKLGPATVRRMLIGERSIRNANKMVRQFIVAKGGIVPAIRTAHTVFVKTGLVGLVEASTRFASRQTNQSQDYQSWIEQYDTPGKRDIVFMHERQKSFKNRPLISIILPVYNTPIELLKETIDSVLYQVYPNWELCIADDNSPNSEVRDLIEKYKKQDKRIKSVFRSVNGHISKASNSALELAEGEWIALLDHDDLLRPHSLYCVVSAINENPRAKLIYSDEDKIDLSGNRFDPYFKPDWNLDLFRSHNLITHLAVYQTQIVKGLGGFDTEFDGAQDYDLALRYVENLESCQIHHIPHVLYHWRVMPGSTALAADEKPYAMLAGEKALNAHLSRVGLSAKATLKNFGYRVDYKLPSPPPLVSIIVPTKNAHKLVSTCVNSIRQKTEYPSYEILLVDNGSDEKESKDVFRELAENGHARLLTDDGPFNYSAINNTAVKSARGEVIVLLNNDTEIISKDWLARLTSYALLDGVGAVGAKLIFPDNRIQHAGVVMGLGGLAAHAFEGFPANSAGYVGRAALNSNFSAVTAACLAVTVENFRNVGGLDEENLKVAYNDVDFCLKLVEMGKRNVFAADVELYHHESATRGYEVSPEKRKRFQREFDFLYRKWWRFVSHDPAYSPNLTLNAADFSLAFPPRCRRPWERD